MCTLKCLKRHCSTVRSIKNVAVLTEDGAFALFFRPHPGGFDSSRVPSPGNLPSKAKKMLMPGGQPGVELGASGIDWCITSWRISINTGRKSALQFRKLAKFKLKKKSREILQTLICMAGSTNLPPTIRKSLKFGRLEEPYFLSGKEIGDT